MLTIPVPGGKLIVYTDSSRIGLGGVLMQFGKVVCSESCPMFTSANPVPKVVFLVPALPFRLCLALLLTTARFSFHSSAT